MNFACLWRAGAINVSLCGAVCGAWADNLSSRGFVCCVGVLFLSCLWWCWGLYGRKIALLGLLATQTGQSSPCVCKMLEIGSFWASRASFIPVLVACGLCWSSFVAISSGDCCRRATAPKAVRCPVSRGRLREGAVGPGRPCPPVPPTTSRRPHSVTCSWHCGVRAVDNEARASCRRIGKQPHAGSGPQAASHGRPPPTADPSRKV